MSSVDLVQNEMDQFEMMKRSHIPSNINTLYRPLLSFIVYRILLQLSVELILTSYADTWNDAGWSYCCNISRGAIDPISTPLPSSSTISTYNYSFHYTSELFKTQYLPYPPSHSRSILILIQHNNVIGMIL